MNINWVAGNPYGETGDWMLAQVSWAGVVEWLRISFLEPFLIRACI